MKIATEAFLKTQIYDWNNLQTNQAITLILDTAVSCGCACVIALLIQGVTTLPTRDSKEFSISPVVTTCRKKDEPSLCVYVNSAHHLPHGAM